jgi:aminomethyltransferase
LAKLKEASDDARPRRIGLALTGKRVPREGYAVLSAGERVGEVTSGTFSPTLGRPIAMAYVEPRAAAPSTRLEIDIRGQAEPADVVKLPSYSRK